MNLPYLFDPLLRVVKLGLGALAEATFITGVFIPPLPLAMFFSFP